MLPDWFECAADRYGDQADYEAIPTYDQAGRLLGVMPLAQGGRRVRFAGAGLGDHFQPVCRPEHEARVAASAAGVFERGNYLILDHIDRDSLWPRAIQRASGRALRTIGYRGDVLPYIDLVDVSWDDYLASKSRNFRSQMRRRTKALVSKCVSG